MMHFCRLLWNFNFNFYLIKDKFVRSKIHKTLSKYQRGVDRKFGEKKNIISFSKTRFKLHVYMWHTIYSFNNDNNNNNKKEEKKSSKKTTTKITAKLSQYSAARISQITVHEYIATNLLNCVGQFGSKAKDELTEWMKKRYTVTLTKSGKCA